MRRAVEGDDWSAVIGQQNLQALGERGQQPLGDSPPRQEAELPQEPPSQQHITTPFARAPVHRSIGNPHL
jgi:hypothetical protein